MMASKARGTKRRGKAGSTKSASGVVPNLGGDTAGSLRVWLSLTTPAQPFIGPRVAQRRIPSAQRNREPRGSALAGQSGKLWRHQDGTLSMVAEPEGDVEREVHARHLPVPPQVVEAVLSHAVLYLRGVVVAVAAVA